MANPQPDEFTKISNELIEAFFKKRISGREWQIIWIIIRKTWGFKKKMDAISKTQFSEFTGIPRQKCQELLNALLEKRIINKGVTQKGNTFFATYGINKDYDKWKVLPKKVTVTQKGNVVLPKKVTEVLPKKVNTKEKKENLKKHSPYSYESELSCFLFQLILERRNSIKKPNFQKWASNIDKILRIDKQDPNEVEDVILWCQQDDFWQDNILSTEKLRKQYDQLALKMYKENPPKPKTVSLNPETGDWE